MKAGRIVMLVIGSLCALVGLGLLAGAGFVRAVCARAYWNEQKLTGAAL